jgi:malonate-semialdehyde dehydrogenase (acetylating) / methylmalonate-semialdehyde dehydrogenase
MLQLSNRSWPFKEFIMVYTVGHFINGKSIVDHHRSQDLYNPATGKLQGRVLFANYPIVEQAIAAAKSAFPAWSQTTLTRRSQILFRFKSLVEQHQNELAKLITQEHGKTLDDSLGSIQRGLAVVEYACGIPNHLKGEFSIDAGTGVDCYALRQPLGICVGITPFNFPAMIPLWMFPLAIACGNTFILKPSEKDPSCGLRLAELMKEAGLPDGVLNVINGDKEAVDGLLTHPDVQAASFVGSTPIAESIYKMATSHGKRVQALGGAKNHSVVMPDANVAQAADAILGAAYGSAGERCMAISVVVAVGDPIGDALVQQLKPKVAKLKIGAGMDAGVEMGPLITQQHLQKVKSYIELGIEEGGVLIVDGRNIKIHNYEQGNFLGGCLFDKVTPNMRIYKEEIFGPVLSIIRVPDFASALKLVNEHELGNGAAIFTRDPNTARTFAKQVQIGMVGINIPIPVPVAQYSFGGWKRSFFGDIHLYGPEGIQFYTKLKTITSKWPESIETDLQYQMPVLG